jgi:XTP/dITP diphosphohydrolase
MRPDFRGAIEGRRPVTTIEKLVIATHNPGKLREIQELLAPLGIECVSAAELGLPEPEEIGNSFVDNADLKARQAADLSGLPALADDSGLAVDALHGLPGIFSARWAEDEAGSRDFGRAMERVWREVEAAGEDAGHDAHFACALSLALPDNGEVQSFEGRVDGTLVWPPRGDKGFGYDPMFVPVGRDQTFGEIDQAEKHRISHRADAFRKLVAALR